MERRGTEIKDVIEFIYLRTGTASGYCLHGNELSGSIKEEEFL